tara:strand:- start:208 stop:345 length:138 start_codon:yes stop_codon:yes gene_type:complete
MFMVGFASFWHFGHFGRGVVPSLPSLDLQATIFRANLLNVAHRMF